MAQYRPARSVLLCEADNAEVMKLLNRLGRLRKERVTPALVALLLDMLPQVIAAERAKVKNNSSQFGGIDNRTGS